MATVKLNPATFEPAPPPPPTVPARYTLELTAEEIAALWCITQCVGGDPDTSVRGYTAAVNDAIMRVLPELYSECWSGVTNGVRQFMDEKKNAIFFNAHTKNHDTFQRMVKAAARKS
jgi:hypothetical protein